MNKEVKEKAKEFALALKNHPDIAAYFKAQEKLEADKGTQQLISQFQEKQRELWLNQQERNLTAAEIMSFRNLQNRVISNPLIKEFSVAQNQAFEFSQSVANRLSELLGVDFATLISPPSSC
jgi:cell fate (sporulation/competence/biofilm development) regulator YlbF (YheA/YmcA/DUF963 family)